MLTVEFRNYCHIKRWGRWPGSKSSIQENRALVESSIGKNRKKAESWWLDPDYEWGNGRCSLRGKQRPDEENHLERQTTKF